MNQRDCLSHNMSTGAKLYLYPEAYYHCQGDPQSITNGSTNEKDWVLLMHTIPSDAHLMKPGLGRSDHPLEER